MRSKDKYGLLAGFLALCLAVIILLTGAFSAYSVWVRHELQAAHLNWWER